MLKIKTPLLYLILLCCHYMIAQQITSVPDSLKKYSYDELSTIIDKKWKMGEETLYYSKVYLLKAKKENNYRKIISAWIWMGIEAKNFDINIKYCDSAISLAKKKNLENLAQLYWDKANIYYDQKNLKEALNYYLIANQYPNKSIELAESINFNIGAIKSTQGDYQEAIAIFKECEDYPRANTFFDYPRYLLALSENYNRINQIKTANEYIIKGIEVCKKETEWKPFLMYFISNRGKNEFKLKQYNKAIQDLSSQLKPIQKLGDYSNYAENCFFIGECYREQHLDEKAIFYYKKVDSIFTAKNDIYPIIIPAYEHLIAYYKKKQDYKQVIYYSDQFIKADKVLNDNYKYITSKINKKYDILKVVADKQSLITALQNDEKKSFVTVLLLLFIITCLSILFYLKTKQNKTKLTKQKELFDAFISKNELKTKDVPGSPQFYEPEIKKRSTTAIDENVVKYITSSLTTFEKNLDFLNNYTIETLSTKFNTNSRYLSIVVNEIKGCTFVQYINKLRMEYVIDGLENNSDFLKYSIQGLSETAGYNSVETFSRAFVAHTKMKPSEFIKQLKIRNISV
jgi:AraC-like DNA-binding protein/tetratricopeptide (TPR) repeat protein